MERAIGETNRRRTLQERYNAEHGITPVSVKKSIFDLSPASGTSDYVTVPILRSHDGEDPNDAMALAELKRNFFGALPADEEPEPRRAVG